MIRAADVREKYPNPSRFNYQWSCFPNDGYCVGGALRSYLALPPQTQSDCVLMTANPILTREAAFEFTAMIIRENDYGTFERAWQLLDEALTYGQPEAVVKTLIESAEEVMA